MSDEDLLRSGLATLTLDQPPAGDRVTAVRGRIRRRTRQRTMAAGALLAVGLLGAATLGPLGGSGRESLPARQVPDEAPGLSTDYRLTITQALVSLPGLSFEEQLETVTAALASLDLPDRAAQKGDDFFIEDGQPRPAALRLDFVSALDRAQREAVRSALASLPGAGVDIRNAPGFAVDLVAPLSPRVVEALGPGRAPEAPDALTAALDGIYGVSRTAQDELVVEYVGPALEQDALDRASRQVALMAGVRADQVRLRRATLSGVSFEPVQD